LKCPVNVISSSRLIKRIELLSPKGAKEKEGRLREGRRENLLFSFPDLQFPLVDIADKDKTVSISQLSNLPEKKREKSKGNEQKILIKFPVLLRRLSRSFYYRSDVFIFMIRELLQAQSDSERDSTKEKGNQKQQNEKKKKEILKT